MVHETETSSLYQSLASRHQHGDVRPSGAPGDVRSERFVRHYRLVSRCSERHVRMTSNRVDARASFDDVYADLRFTSESFGSHLRIQSARTSAFMCFNKLGQLIMKTFGSRDPRCIFRELYTVDRFSEFQSVYNTDWFVMFGKNGERLHGTRWSPPPGGSSSDRQQPSNQNQNQATARHQLRHNGRSHRRKTSPDLCRRFVKIPSPFPVSYSSSSSGVVAAPNSATNAIDFQRLYAKLMSFHQRAAASTNQNERVTERVASELTDQSDDVKSKRTADRGVK